MSGSSISRNSRSSPTSARRRSSGSRTASADSASRPARAVAGSSVARRQDLVEVLGDDVGDRLAAQRGVEDVGRDLGVEGDRRRRSRAQVVREAGDEDRLDLVADQRGGEPLEQAAQRVAASGPSAATTRPSAPATASASGVPRRGRGSSARSATPTAGWAASQARGSPIALAPRTSIRPGSRIAAASADRQVLRAERPVARPSPPAVARRPIRRGPGGRRRRRSRAGAAARRSRGRVA